MSKKIFYLIGGSKQYGSGKVISFLKLNFSSSFNNFSFIETQKSRFEIIKSLFKITKNSKILFQPSISFPAFLRDILIIIIIRKKSKYIYFLSCVDIGYKNPILKYKIFRYLFFGNNKIMASSQFTKNLKGMIRIPPYFEKDKLNPFVINNINLPIAALYLGYLNKMKGWNKFNHLINETITPIKAIAIGTYPSKESILKSINIEILRGRNTVEIEKSLQTISNKYFPILIFLSNEDFSPLIVLESGYWGIPIACINKSKSHNILRRFLPENCYTVIDNIEQILNSKKELITSKKNMWSYVNSLSEGEFSKTIIKEFINN